MAFLIGANTIIDDNGNLSVTGGRSNLSGVLNAYSANSNVVVNGNIVVSGGSINGTVSSAGTVTTNAQPNITSVGTLSSLSVSGGITGNLTGAASQNVLKTGDTITGNLSWNTTGTGIQWDMNTDGASIRFYNVGDGDVNSRLEFQTSDNNNEYFSWTHLPSGGPAYESMRLVPNASGAAALSVYGNINVSGVSSLGPVGNVRISGGINGQVLTTDGLGSLSWTSAAGGGGINGYSAFFTPQTGTNTSYSGTFTVPAGVTKVKVTMTAAGGGMGGGSSSGSYSAGGSGSTNIVLLTVTPGSTISWTRGAGGVAGNQNISGGTGGDTTITYSGTTITTGAGGGGGTVFGGIGGFAGNYSTITGYGFVSGLMQIQGTTGIGVVFPGATNPFFGPSSYWTGSVMYGDVRENVVGSYGIFPGCGGFFTNGTISKCRGGDGAVVFEW